MNEKILVIKLGALGDFIQALGAMQAIFRSSSSPIIGKMHVRLTRTRLFSRDHLHS